MSLVPRLVSQELRPFFRMLEDPFFTPSTTGMSRTRNSVFQPNFDVREEKDSYVLEGELPGLNDKSKLDVHFADAQTLVIKGRVEHSRSEGNPPQSTSEAAHDQKVPKPTVEDENAEAAGSSDVVMASGESTEVANKPSQSGSRFWVSERMVGEFQRSFSFPNTVDQDAVKASLKDGILSIVVPKKQSNVGKRINVE